VYQVYFNVLTLSILSARIKDFFLDIYPLTDHITFYAIHQRFVETSLSGRILGAQYCLALLFTVRSKSKYRCHVDLFLNHD